MKNDNNINAHIFLLLFSFLLCQAKFIAYLFVFLHHFAERMKAKKQKNVIKKNMINLKNQRQNVTIFCFSSIFISLCKTKPVFQYILVLITNILFLFFFSPPSLCFFKCLESGSLWMVFFFFNELG